MTRVVRLTDAATRDLADIHDYISEFDTPQHAEHVLRKIEEALRALKAFPNRGAYPKELAALGIREYREVFFKPYRIIYRVVDREVIVYVIADGRRDMQSLLARRMLQG